MTQFNIPNVRWTTILSTMLLTFFVIALTADVYNCLAQQPRESADPYFMPQTDRTEANQLAPGNPAGPIERTADNRSFIPASSPSQSGYGAIGSGASASSPGYVNTMDDRRLSPLTPDPATTNNETNPAPQGQLFEQGRVLARVGGHPIFVADLTLEARQLIDQHINDAPESIKQQEMAKLIPRLLPKYIQAKLLYVDVIGDLPDTANLKDVLETASKQFDDEIVPKLMEKAGVDSQMMLDAHYRSLGSSLRRTRENWAQNELVKYMVRSKINTDPEVSHREIYDTYVAERDGKWAVEARVHWERLSVRFDQFTTRQQAWDALAEMGNDVVFGASFSAVSKKGSQDPLASQGGDQGWANFGSLADKSLEELLFSMPLNELSDIRETDRGLEIVRVQDREDAGYISFEKAQPQIRKKLLESKQEMEFQRYAEKVRERVPVEIFE